jgi:hypothetical protein
MAQVSVTYTFQDPAGEPLALGTATFRLSTDAAIDSVQIAANKVVSVALNSSGSLTADFWPNDDMTPEGTVYIVKSYAATGQLAWEGELTI